MKRFKQFDLVIQSLLIAAFLFKLLVLDFYVLDDVIIFYYLLGGWQVSSMVIHYFTKFSSPMNNFRQLFTKLCLTTILLVIPFLLLALAQFAVPAVLYLNCLLWLFPVLALFYVYICWRECRSLVRRELVHLK
jgi:hypothetical protein